ncbi:M15 family metallopeptidase [Christensenellaceae bacterium OttesenSCG-928-L17]|nr:M15 family metallopeptidase [Christensenellaceae bacterium OttesenSCG-928-L17]
MKKLLTIALAVLILITSSSSLAAIKNQEETGYQKENAERYIQYAKKNTSLSMQDIIVRVNLKLDEGNYTNIQHMENPSSLSVFVSKHYALKKDYKPENLVSVSSKYAQSGVKLRNDCYEAFLKMAQAGEKEGLTFYIKSGYRTNRKRGGANSLWYAWPGHSEHQTGLAFDLRKKGVTYKTLGEYKYHKTSEYKWLCENAYEYGFILSYPDGYSGITGFGFEPWHWRYVGVETATEMKKLGIKTYHEYWAKYIYDWKEVV